MWYVLWLHVDTKSHSSSRYTCMYPMLSLDFGWFSTLHTHTTTPESQQLIDEALRSDRYLLSKIQTMLGKRLVRAAAATDRQIHP